MATITKPVAQDDTLQRVADALEDIADKGQSLGIRGATVGDSAIISQVDENGKPILWRAGEVVTKDKIEQALGFAPANDSEVYHEWALAYDGTNITKDGTIQSFSDIHSAVNDKSKFVYVIFQNRLYIPQYDTGTLVSFSCSYLDGNTPTMRRIRMTSDGAIATTTETFYNKTEADAQVSQLNQSITNLEQDKVDKTDYAPVSKTEGMTQAVGKDDDGKLWTAPTATWGNITGDITAQTDLMAKFDEYAKLSKLTVTMVGSQGNIPTGNSVQVYEVFPDGNEVLVASAVYGTTPVSFMLSDGLEYKVTGTATVEGFYIPDVINVDLLGDKSVTVTYFEIAAPTNMQDVHNLIRLGLEEEIMSVGDVINVHWTATNGAEYDAPATVAELGKTYIDHETGERVKGVRFQFLRGFPDYPQFDAVERELATETNALADTYYYGTNDNSTFVLLSYSEGDAIDYSAYTYIYHNSFRDTSFNILRYGNNLLEYSARLQWLNSAEPKAIEVGVDGWWRSTHLGDTAPTQATTIHGFQHGFSKGDFLDYVLDEDFTVGQNTVIKNGTLVTLHGKFRDPMVVEVYGSPQISGEGDNHYWPLWEQLCKNSPTNPLSDPGNGNCSARRVMNLDDTSFWTAFLSSCNRSYSNFVWGVSSSTGRLTSGDGASTSARSAPAFVIV